MDSRILLFTVKNCNLYTAILYLIGADLLCVRIQTVYLGFKKNVLLVFGTIRLHAQRGSCF